MKKFYPYLGISLLVAIIGFVGLVKIQPTVASANADKLTVCHLTASATNPWVVQQINANELQSHLDNGDFLITFGHPCPPVTPTPTASPSATPTPTVEITPTETPIPTITPCMQFDNEFPVPCPTDTPTPTPTPTDTPTPTPEINNGGGSSTGSSTNAPVCSDGSVVKVAANPHVIRQGDKATVNFFITEGDSANIYYKVVGQSDWQYSVLDVKPNSDNFVSYTISGLDANLGYDFGIQQKQGCGGGQLVTAVIVDGASYKPVLFKFSYWEWSK